MEKGHDFFVYDADHCLESMELEDAYGATSHRMSYVYNSDHDEIETSTMGGKKRTTAYDAFGRLGTETWDTTANFVTSYSYRAAADGSFTPVIEGIDHNGKQLVYTYYDDGNIKQVQSPDGTVFYAYDALGQLIRVNDPVEGKTFVYTYDAGFNMTSEKTFAYTTEETITGEPISQRAFTYDSSWKDQMITCGGKALTYDAAGNLTSFDGMTFEWMNGRQLNRVTKADGTSAFYVYNHNHQRTVKNANGRYTTYMYSGDLLIQEKSSSHNLKFTYNSPYLAGKCVVGCAVLVKGAGNLIEVVADFPILRC